MFNPIIISIFFINFGCFLTSYLEVEGSYLKPKLERHNVLNKGVWIKNKFKEDLFEKTNLGEFIFRPNSVDADTVVQNDFDAFGENYMQSPPSVSSYVDRTKRAANNVRKRRFRKSVKSCINCKVNKSSMEDSPVLAKTKFLNDLKPASVFNDYPYEVAILLNNELKGYNDSNTDVPTAKDIKTDSLILKDHLQDTISNSSDSNGKVSPKRSMKHDYESEIVKKLEFTEAINNTENFIPGKVDRNVFDKDDKVWHQNSGALGDVNLYKVVPKLEYDKSKPVSERGLIKVISMLTKTFKKIMKQHNEIKTIHKKLHTTHEDFTKSVDFINSKFQDFDVKYETLNKLSEKLKAFETKLNGKEEFFRNKEKDMSKNLLEFENQQKKFLAQQRQFYNVQKLMLAQNEKISIKQNLIAKTQSEISHRQNNFARILKKAKQLYLENKNPVISKLRTNIKAKDVIKDDDAKTVESTTSQPITESIKINLFSIPTSNRIENHDVQMMREKDEQPIDDLIYKYYFNNTFIDSLMKSKVLTSLMTASQNSEFARNAKNKRDELLTTLMYPISNENLSQNDRSLKRDRRWIHHHSRRKLRRKSRGKGDNAGPEINDAKNLSPKRNYTLDDVNFTAEKRVVKHNSSDPFYKMALSFCHAIGQNKTEQTLSWCIEKSLRRLQFLDSKHLASQIMPPQDTKILTQSRNKFNNPTQATFTPQATRLSTTTATNTVSPTQPDMELEDITNVPVLTTILTGNYSPQPIFFPDNDELESNLREFDIQPDTEGNFYYDGSLHASDIVVTDSDGFSDIMPGLDSNSRIDVDPQAFDLQAKRREFVRRINENIMKNINMG